MVDSKAILTILGGTGWDVRWEDGALVCHRWAEASWPDVDVTEVTFEMLQALSETCGTRLIDIKSTVHAGFPGTEVTPAESDTHSVEVWIRWE